MLMRHEIILDKSYYDVITLLKLDDSQGGTLGENGDYKFRVFKSITSLYDHRMFRYVISGKIENMDSNVKVTYIIHPVVPVYIAFLFLIVGFVLSFVRFLLHMSSPQIVLIAALINVVFCLRVLFQEKECIHAFEKKLRG